ncbi:MAG: thiamine pyrophosphate-binding protein, partial [Deltaproteobacteria bacterium]|nr:thiamine pyrophosphate-binding protein [Deltaproteobacteria bacterium]
MRQTKRKLRPRTPFRPTGGRGARTTVAALIVRCLKAEGVTTVYLVPGGPIMPLIEALFLAGGLRVVMAKHEAGAAFMADGHQRVAGGIGVCVTTAGPGATNALTAVASSWREGIPILVISGQPGLSAFGKEPTQDSSCLGVDTVELFRRVTKQSVLLTSPERTGDVLRGLIRTALAPKMGPVHLSIPADLLKRQIVGRVFPPARYRAESRSVDLAAIEEAARLLVQAKRVVILAGSGVRRSGASKELRALAELLGAPVATSGKAKGIFGEQNPLSLQVFGFAGSPRADEVFFDKETDTILVIGSTLGELTSHAW